MKTKEEIEQLADETSKKHGFPERVTISREAYIRGYTQCQEDMVDKIVDQKHIPMKGGESWDDVFRAFYLAEQQVPIGAPRLILAVWLTENYNPPTKKQD